MTRENAGIPSSTAMAARERELQGYAREFLAVRTQIKTGFDLIEKTKPARERILSLLGATAADWADWRWQLKNRITSVERLSQIVPLAPAEVAVVRRVEREFRWAISSYYASLLDPDDPACPLRRQAIPSAPELAETGELDPVGEGATSPVPGVVRRYPDRLIIYVTNQCAMSLRGYTSGLAMPTYAVNAPGGGGKVPLMPQYVIRLGEGTATVRTWEGWVVEIPNEG